MEKNWRISDSEWLVLRCLWKRSPLEIKEIQGMLQEETGWTGNMVRSLVVRLLDKGAIGAETQDRYFRYYPIAAEEECIRQETRSFVDRVFEGSVSKLFAAFAGSGKLSEKDRREIRAMLEKMEEEK
ncbi:MAG: BlaI/MecI/CopY family transcriptional regulator [Oscillospiraceae bacterium]|nr:BlaI/MecI/CopY family transcriptional regulator [Oscillospiraceae bacterium]